jgi:hypothetical protein
MQPTSIVTDNLKPVQEGGTYQLHIKARFIRGPPSLSQAIELVSGLARRVRDGFDSDVTNYLLAIVSGYEPIAQGADEPVPEVGGCDSEQTRKKS